jgi:hypothetical protein
MSHCIAQSKTDATKQNQAGTESKEHVRTQREFSVPPAFRMLQLFFAELSNHARLSTLTSALRAYSAAI